MGKRIASRWIENKKEGIEKGRFVSTTLSYNPAAQWLITYLADRGQSVKVTNLDAGVKRITPVEKCIWYVMAKNI